MTALSITSAVIIFVTGAEKVPESLPIGERFWFRIGRENGSVDLYWNLPYIIKSLTIAVVINEGDQTNFKKAVDILYQCLESKKSKAGTFRRSMFQDTTLEYYTRESGILKVGTLEIIYLNGSGQLLTFNDLKRSYNQEQNNLSGQLGQCLLRLRSLFLDFEKYFVFDALKIKGLCPFYTSDNYEYHSLDIFHSLGSDFPPIKPSLLVQLTQCTKEVEINFESTITACLLQGRSEDPPFLRTKELGLTITFQAPSGKMFTYQHQHKGASNSKSNGLWKLLEPTCHFSVSENRELGHDELYTSRSRKWSCGSSVSADPENCNIM
jgi:hypothetical protein